MSTSFLLIGCGRIGEKHAAIIVGLGDLLGACDIIPEKADLISNKYGGRSFYSIEEMLKGGLKADIAVVCTPNGLHCQHSIKFLQNGMHVLCEKPMALSVRDCRVMITEADKAFKRIFVVKQNRFNPPLEALRKTIDQGKLGKIYSFQLNCFWNRQLEYYQNSWHGTLDLDGGTLFTQFSHFIDLLPWLIGDVKETRAVLSNYAHKGKMEFEDTGMVIFEFYNGVTGALNYTVNSHQTNMEGSITIFGERGTVKVGGKYLNKIEYQNIKGFEIPILPAGNGANDYGQYQGSMSNHGKVYENMLAFLDKRESLSVSAEDGLKTVELIEMIYNSAVRLS